MPLLEAFLALALTMLSLAMIATLLVEFAHRVARTRAKDLKGMLQEFYDSELKPLVEKELQKTGAELDEHRAKFINKLLTNSLLSEGSTRPHGYLESNLKPLVNLSTQDFFKRLAYTDIGKELKARTETEIDEFVDSLSLAYEGFGAAATDLFKRRAQVLSLIAGLIVAFAMNVNALLVFQAYLDDPLLRAKVVAKADAISEKLQDSIDKGKIEGFKTKQEAEDFVRSFKKDVSSLGELGITTGYTWEVHPGKAWKNEKKIGLLGRVRDLAFWALGVIGTGLLIGLGGPFWFNIVRKLTEMIKVVRGDTATDGDEASRVFGVAADPRRHHKDTFKKIGGPPPLVKAQANLDAATSAATDSDYAVKAAADALKAAQDAATADIGNMSKVDAVAVAEAALKNVIDVKQKMDLAREAAHISLTNAESGVK